MASYPGSVFPVTTHNTGDTIQPADVNNCENEINAVETGLLNGFQHSLIPNVDDTYTLGSSTNRWVKLWTQDIDLDGTLTLASGLPVGSGGTGANLSATGGTGQYLKQVSAGAAITVGTIPEADLPNLVGWTDYSGTSTIVGWASFTTKFLSYRRLGSLVFVLFNFQGTSNATSVSFTLPLTSNAAWSNANIPISAQDSGAVVASPVCQLAAASSTVNVYKDNTALAWTNSGTKMAFGQFWYTL